ncbi:hypothetical protein SAMN05216191_101535 [Paenibacillus jilunlii]|uniref:Uncharacterized protein n=1 Tax=Paenibacillus jilunlii TaxID=682956 RepID=A0A1G9GRH1_9BACL|nr:hypothetical protein SAMN05216191_101535 [Paenibacillus jilunlii]
MITVLNKTLLISAGSYFMYTLNSNLSRINRPPTILILSWGVSFNYTTVIHYTGFRIIFWPNHTNTLVCDKAAVR